MSSSNDNQMTKTKFFDYLPGYATQLEKFVGISNLSGTIKFYRQNYTGQPREISTSVRGFAENIAKGYANKHKLNSERSDFNDLIHILYLKEIITNQERDILNQIRKVGNNGAHGGQVKVKDAELCLVNLDRLLRATLYRLAGKPLTGYPRIVDTMKVESQLMYNTFERKLIYIQTAKNEDGLYNAYNGLQKIGDASVPDDLEADFTRNSDYLRKYAEKRINQYMNTAGVPYVLHWAELAVNNKKQFFRDYAVHEVLKRSGISSVPLGQDEHGKPNEWFRVSVDDAKEAIKAVKEGRSYLSVSSSLSSEEQIEFRPEQLRAIKQTKDIFKTKNEMLWNAKMRFGKTLSSLQVVSEYGFKKVLIMTHRPVVSDGWFEDFGKIFKNGEFKYGSKDQGERIEALVTMDTPFIYFASIQDLRGSKWAGGAHEKNYEFLKIEWDLIIIDEAHEGNETELANNVKNKLKRANTKILELSGTPFNLFDKYDEDNVFTWDYTMEQEAKSRWSEEHPNEPNPYDGLPKVSMYTFDIGKTFNYLDETKAFNFKEFFRSENGELVHKSDVIKFLDQITTEDSHTNYPYSTEEYRRNLRHTLWLLPGVEEANALEKVMKKHHIFKDYNIVNVVHRGDDGNTTDSDLELVRQAIGTNPAKTKTITLTVRKLTTGVNVKEWTGVFFLNNTESPTTYLQAAFRAQTPFSHEEMGIKKNCYVFDFAPDRALKIMSESIGLSSKKGKINTTEQKEKMAKMLNFFPIIGQYGNMMVEFSVDNMLTQLKKAYAEKAVRSGFEDNSLYNDNLLGLDEASLSDFNDLKEIIGTSDAKKNDFKVIVAENGFTEEEHEQAVKAERKPKRERTTEEEEAIKKLQELRKQKAAMISILRGVSIRIPMMIYGMKVELDEDVSLEKFIKLVDDQSWEEFMPKGLTKAIFKKFTCYYDNEVFIEAGRIIRRKAKSYDKLDVIERTEKIAELFSTFKNPDKETVLTPWRVVNLQLISTFGGLSFYDKDFAHTTIDGTSALHWVDIEETSNIYQESVKILDVNSKTGLYPLFVATSLYYCLMQEENEKGAGKFDSLSIWKKVLKENVYAIAKTPMAKTITQRTLAGYQLYDTNVEFIDLVTLIKEENTNISDQIERAFNRVKFDVIIGNPPYQEMDGGAQASASPIYQNFVQVSKEMNPKYISLIMPSRWYAGGKGLDDFRDEMLTDVRISELHDWLTPEDIFPNTNIRGGVCYFLWDKDYNNESNLTHVVTYEHNKVINDVMRPMKFGEVNIFIRDSRAINILSKVVNVQKESHNNEWLDRDVSPRKPFGFTGSLVKDDKFHDTPNGLVSPIKCYAKGVVGYVEHQDIVVRESWVDKWKVFTARANNIGIELNDDNFNTIIGTPKTICTETYLVIGADLNLDESSTNNLSSYLKTKFARYLHSLAKSSHDATRTTYRFIPLQDFSNNGDIDWSASAHHIDNQLYEKYGLTKDEINYIEAKIKPMS